MRIKIFNFNTPILALTLLVCSFFASPFGYSQWPMAKMLHQAPLTMPVSNATITVIETGSLFVSDSNGVVVFDQIPDGRYHLEIAAPGFAKVALYENLLSKDTLTIFLDVAHYNLDEVTVSNHGILQRETVTNVAVHPLKEIQKIPVIGLGDALANIPGVSQATLGAGISKPVIRGLSGSSVVTYVNGLRIQNQQWGDDHGLPITSLGIGKVEVIKGPSSLLYGADALGGVIYFADEPYAPSNQLQLNVSSQFDENSNGTTNQMGIKWSKKKLKLAGYGRFSSFADYRTPNGQYVLNSRQRQQAAKFSMGYNKGKWLFNLRYNYNQARIGLPGHTHDLNPDISAFLRPTTGRGLNAPAQAVTNHFTLIENQFFFPKDHFYFSIGHTYNALREHEEKVLSPDIILFLNNGLYHFKWTHNYTDNLKTIIGTQGMLQFTENGAKATETLIPNAQTSDAGVYALGLYNYKKWNFQAGARYDIRQIITESNGTDFGAVDQYFDGYNASLGASRSAKKTTLRMNISTGFRVPNLPELTSNGVHHGSFRYELGNVNLETEQAAQADVSFAYHIDDLNLIINPFYNRITNYIYLEPTGTFIDDYPVFNYAQAGFAQLYGTDFTVHYHPHKAHWLHLQSAFTYVIATDENNNPLPRIPQGRLNNQVSINIQKGKAVRLNKINIRYRYFFEQNQITVNETVSPDYHLLDVGLSLGITQKQNLTVDIGVRNLLNQRYIPHLSALKTYDIPNPGIGGYLKIAYNFNYNTSKK